MGTQWASAASAHSGCPHCLRPLKRRPRQHLPTTATSSLAPSSGSNPFTSRRSRRVPIHQKPNRNRCLHRRLGAGNDVAGVVAALTTSLCWARPC